MLELVVIKGRSALLLGAIKPHSLWPFEQVPNAAMFPAGVPANIPTAACHPRSIDSVTKIFIHLTKTQRSEGLCSACTQLSQDPVGLAVREPALGTQRRKLKSCMPSER